MTAAFKNTADHEKYEYNEKITLYPLKQTGKHSFFFFTGKWKEFHGLRSVIIKEV